MKGGSVETEKWYSVLVMVWLSVSVLLGHKQEQCVVFKI